MAEKYFVIMDRSANGPNEELNRKAGKEGKTLANIETAKIVKLEAESVADAQNTVRALFTEYQTTTPVVVTEAQYKES